MVVTGFVGDRHQHDLAALLVAVVTPEAHHLAHRREDVLLAALVGLEHSEGLLDFGELIGWRLGQEGGLLAVGDHGREQRLITHRQLADTLQRIQLAVDPLQSLVNQFPLADQAARRVEHPDDHHLAFLQVVGDFPGDQVERRFELHDGLADGSLDHDPVINLDPLGDVVGDLLQFGRRAFEFGSRGSLGLWVVVLSDADARRIDHLTDFQLPLVGVGQLVVDRLLGLLDVHGIVHRCLDRRHVGRPVIGFEEQSGEIEHDPDVQQQADHGAGQAQAASGIVELIFGMDQLKLDHPIVVDTGNRPGVPVRLPVLPRVVGSLTPHVGKLGVRRLNDGGVHRDRLRDGVAGDVGVGRGDVRVMEHRTVPQLSTSVSDFSLSQEIVSVYTTTSVGLPAGEWLGQEFTGTSWYSSAHSRMYRTLSGTTR